MKVQGKGGRLGIHLFVKSGEQKYWLYVFFFPKSAVYAQAQELNVGDCIQVTTVPGKNDHTVVEALEKRT